MLYSGKRDHGFGMLNVFFCTRYNVNVCVVHITMLLLIVCLVSTRTDFGTTSKSNTRHVAPSTRRTYQSGLNAFNIPPFLASSLTLEYFCVYVSQHVSYKILKVYLPGIRLDHIEQGLADPTESASLHLVCRGIRRQQGDNRRTRLPITINLLQVLKEQLQTSPLLYCYGTTHAVGCVYCGFLWIFTRKRTNTQSLLVKHHYFLEANVHYLKSVKDRPISSWPNYPIISH